MKDNTRPLTPNRVAEDLKRSADVLNKSDDKSIALQEIRVKDEARSIVQNAALKVATTKIVRDRREIVESKLDTYLEQYRTAIEAKARATALLHLVEVARNATTNEPLDKILDFFRRHLHDDCLRETVALQGTADLNADQSVKARLFYALMRGIASRSYTRRTVQMEIIRNIFRNDVLVNWVTMKVRR